MLNNTIFLNVMTIPLVNRIKWTKLIEERGERGWRRFYCMCIQPPWRQPQGVILMVAVSSHVRPCVNNDLERHSLLLPCPLTRHLPPPFSPQHTTPPAPPANGGSNANHPSLIWSITRSRCAMLMVDRWDGSGVCVCMRVWSGAGCLISSQFEEMEI